MDNAVVARMLAMNVFFTCMPPKAAKIVLRVLNRRLTLTLKICEDRSKEFSAKLASSMDVLELLVLPRVCKSGMLRASLLVCLGGTGPILSGRL
jgi:hypothetical protein